MQVPNMEKLRFLLLGKTGHGKSSTGNSILGYRKFKTSHACTSMTGLIEQGDAEFKNSFIKVVDGPGMHDTRFNCDENAIKACSFLAEAIAQFNNDLTAFLVVCKYGTRCTKEELRTFQDLKRIFGDDYLRKFGIVVVTGGDEFERNLADDEEEDHPKTFKEWCEQENEALGGLLAECEYRCVLFDNKTRNVGKKERQMAELISMSRRILASGEQYTSEFFQEIAEQRDKFMADERLFHLQEEFRIKVSLIEKAVYDVCKKPSPQTAEILKQKVQRLLDGIETTQEMTPDLQNLKGLAERMKSAANSLLETLRQEVPDEATKKKLLDQIDELWKQMKTNQKAPSNMINILLYGCILMLVVAGIGGIGYLIWSGKAAAAVTAMGPSVNAAVKATAEILVNVPRFANYAVNEIVRLIFSSMKRIALTLARFPRLTAGAGATALSTTEIIKYLVMSLPTVSL